MKKLVSLDLPRLHHAEFGQLIVRFFEDLDSSSVNTGTDADFKRMLDAIQAQIPTYNGALDQIRANEESAKIAELDMIRDADLQALRDSLKPYKNAKTQTEKDAYVSVKILLDQYKKVQHASYEEETNRVNTLVEKLLSSDYSSQVSVLGIIKFANHLSDSNNDFNRTFWIRSFQQSKKTNFDVKELRKLLTQDYKQMASYILTLANVKDDTFYQDVLAALNNGRTYFSSVVLSRRTGNKKDV
ncbi:DUF6261 family protein [Chryseobacterium sp.]|uniref:DUF6261 family protein n=1 Tax=Chryseobacterium sp. TaxID=1871047 RepID=UPI00289A0A72|nr:DUF6261 family protein [Chryseobacterium sp.]